MVAGMSSTLTGSSTLAEVQAAYDDACSYQEDRDVAKARALITAARILKRRYATESQKGTDRVRLDENLRQLDREIVEARAWLTRNDPNGAAAAPIVMVPGSLFRGSV